MSQLLLEIKQYKKFFHHLMYPQFRGMWVFGTQRSLENWCRRFSPYLLELGGTYVKGNTVWNFPWGAQLKLIVYHTNSDSEKVRGVELSDVEYETGLNLPDSEVRAILSRVRIRFPELKK